MKSRICSVFLSFLFVFLFAQLAQAEVKLPRIFSSNMVLQQGIEIPVWGWAEPGERVTVQFNGATKKVKTSEDGKWKLKLPVQEYGGPFSLLIKGTNIIQFDNVMVGEVWICSGQSNMQWTIANSNNPEEEIALAKHQNIRLFQVPRVIGQFPEKDIESGEWLECSPETVGEFSAVGYFFGRDLQEKLDVPIGLIHSAWGGTVAETWSSSQTISKDPDFKKNWEELQNIDMEAYKEIQLAKVKELCGGDVLEKDISIKEGKLVWSAYDFDDGNWNSIKTPDLWENQGFMGIDGVGWYRKEIWLKEEQTKSDLKLHLGKIDDSDITWMNGVEIGKTINAYNEERVYIIDAKYLKPGKNVLVVRVNDTGGGGGIWGDPDNQFMLISDEKMDISGDWKFKISKATVQSVNVGPNSYPTLLFNAMINPIVPYGIKGAIWYQGESNANRAKQYQRVFPEMITDWRTHWQQGDFSFLFVSLANFRKPVEKPAQSEWAELREAQTKTLSLPNTGMAMAIDIGEANDIHPRNKQEVGKRLMLNALKVAYGKEVVHSGPMFQSAEFVDGRAIVTFTETGSGLHVKDKYGYVKAFTLAGEDKVFHWAKAKLVGNKVEVWSPMVPNPIAVRMGWADNPDDLNLYNKEGLPANPFRSDDWQGITK